MRLSLVQFRHLIQLSIATAMFTPFYAAATGQIFEMNTSVRALGRGNTYLGLVKDADSLFYNPAGLARVSGFNWLIADPKVGTSGLEAFDTVKDLKEDDGFEEAVRELYGDHVWAGAGVKSIVTIPYFGLGVYDTLDASVDVDNPVYPNLDVSMINDFGYIAGLAVPISPFLHLGAVAKRIKRTGAQVPFGSSFIATLDPEKIEDNIKNEGVGYGFDVGANLVLPGPFAEVVLSGVWKDIGNTKFRSGDPAKAPPRQEQEMALGAALNIDLPLISISPAIDLKHLNRNDIQLPKKIHVGVEVGLPLIDLRAGLSQGYYTLGVGANLGILRVDAATYGVEIGEYAGQREDRRYVLQMTLELGFDPGFNILGGGSGGGGSKSPSKRLKQRR